MGETQKIIKLIDISVKSLNTISDLAEALLHINALARLAKHELEKRNYDSVGDILSSIIIYSVSKSEEVLSITNDLMKVMEGGEDANSTNKED